MRQPLRHLTIINQTAGSYSAWEVKEIEKQLKRFPSSLTGEVVVTSSLSELEATLIRHQGECPDLLGLGGGDDTASWVLTMAERVWGRIPEIAYFSMGRVNSLTAFLGLSDGLADKIKKVGKMPSTKALQLARYISDRASFEQELQTREVALLDINGRKGFNIGLGAVPRILWTYFGRSIRDYQALEQSLSEAAPENYPGLLEERLQRKNHYGFVRNLGAVYALGTALQTIMASANPYSALTRFYQQPLPAKIYLDGRRVDGEMPPLTAIFVSSYGELNLGVKGITLTLNPEAANNPRKVRAVLCPEPVLGVVRQLPKLARGEKLDKVYYMTAREMRIEADGPILATVEDGFIAAREFTVTLYKHPLRFVAPF